MADPVVPCSVPERICFPEEEKRTLEHWRSIDAFRESHRLSQGRPTFSFYDGPPFATGLPHYGHILAGTIKDTVTRYAYQTGHHVPRRFGWDCHGVPIEFEIEKQLSIRTQEDVLELGIPKYNAECRKIVMRYAKEWENAVERMGRWIDFEDDYKTMDASFMESVWWVFKRLHAKGLVYQGVKVLAYSIGLRTPLSNFEASLNYKNIDDPAITVAFPLIDEPDVSLLAWTTTPWTLPSNLALCVNSTLTYVQVMDQQSKRRFVLAEGRLGDVFKQSKNKEGFSVEKKMKGSELVGKKYSPPFEYFIDQYASRGFKVVADSYVMDTDGTGIVHQAPAFGEDDHRVCIANGIIDKDGNLPCPVDMNGKFTEPVTDLAGVMVREANGYIIESMKVGKRLIKHDSITHSYPFCYRSDTPLIYRAVPSWFIGVEAIRDKLIRNNESVLWAPEVVGSNRFGSWLKTVRDWNVSRNRFWGTPIPIWRNEETGEILVVGSIAELEELSGASGITDIHREFVDGLEIRSPKTGSILSRVEQVFDCWFESGAMPYASRHYPHECSAEDFKSGFPADFVAEGLDQTRGWFYTLLVISTALFDCPPYKNIIVNGMVLAEDGKKMSKRLKNYPDPSKIINEYGADSLRMYLINSPSTRAEPLRFQETGVRDVLKEMMLPWFNAYRFFVQNTRALFERTRVPLSLATNAAFAHRKNSMDRWIESTQHSLVSFVRGAMASYRLHAVLPRLLSFVDSLTNWYIRLNRQRLKGTNVDEEENRAALGTLGGTLLSLCRLMAPFCPLFSEHIYSNLKCIAEPSERMASVHFLMIPDVDSSKIDIGVEATVSYIQNIIILGRKARAHRKLSLKQPLSCLEVVHRNEETLRMMQGLDQYVKDELNVRQVFWRSNESDFVKLKADADGKVLGKRLGKNFQQMRLKIKNLKSEDVGMLEREGEVIIDGTVIKRGDVKIRRELNKSNIGDAVQIEASGTGNGLLILLHTAQDAVLIREGIARETTNRIQKLRKVSCLDRKDPVEVFLSTEDEQLRSVFRDLSNPFCGTLNAPVMLSGEISSHAVILEKCEERINGHIVNITLVRAALIPDVRKISKLVQDNMKVAEIVARVVRCRTKEGLGITDTSRGSSFDVAVTVQDKKFVVELVIGEHVYVSSWDLFAFQML